LGILYALSYSYFLFSEEYSWGVIGGMGLVVGGVLLNLLYRPGKKAVPKPEG